MALWATFLMWAAVAASAVGWGLAVFGAERATPVPAMVRVAVSGAPTGDWARVLGADPPPASVAAQAPPAESTRFKLVGVIAPSTPGVGFKGLAVIVVDGKPARAFRAGAEIESGRVLREVSLRGVAIGPREGATSIHLALAPPEPAATGTLPSAYASAAAGARAASPPAPATPLARFPATVIPGTLPSTATPPVVAAPLPTGVGPETALRPAKPGPSGVRLELSAPSFLLDKPADTAPSEAQGVQMLNPQNPSAAPRSDR